MNALDQSSDIVALLGSDLRFLGDVAMRHEVAASIASAIIHPITHETYSWIDASRQEEEATNCGAEVSNQSYSTHSAEGSVGGVTTESENEAPPARENTPLQRSYQSELTPQSPLKQKSETKFQPVLDSLLGSSAHILDFRSPKVSDHFHSLVSNSSISQQYRSDAQVDIKQYESKSIRTLSKSSCTLIKKTEHGSKSGFEGEILCRIDLKRKMQLSATDRTIDLKAKRLCARENSPIPKQNRIQNTFKEEERIDTETDCIVEWEDFQAPPKAICVEEKWDRILCVDEES